MLIKPESIEKDTNFKPYIKTLIEEYFAFNNPSIHQLYKTEEIKTGTDDIFSGKQYFAIQIIKQRFSKYDSCPSYTNINWQFSKK